MPDQEKEKRQQTTDKTKSASAVLEPDPEIGRELSLEKTRLDIQSDSELLEEATRTKINNDSKPDSAEEENTDKKFHQNDWQMRFNRLYIPLKALLVSTVNSIGSKTPSLFSFFQKRKLPNIKIGSMKGWGSFFCNIFYILLGIAILIVLIDSCLFSFKIGSNLRWIIAGAGLLSIFFSLVTLVLRRPFYWLFGFPLLCILSLLIYNTLFYDPTTVDGLALLRIAPLYAYNLVWLFLLLFEVVLIVGGYPRSWFVKILLLLVAFYGLLGLGLNYYYHVPLEASWEGVNFLSRLPYFALQPIYIVFHLWIPLFLMVSLFSFLFSRKQKAQKGLILLNIIILIISGFLGFLLIYQNRIPSGLSYFVDSPLGVGEVQMKKEGDLLELRTLTLEQMGSDDLLERYRMEVKPLELEDEKVSKSKKDSYLLQVSREGDLPVLFLTKEDFHLYGADERIAHWDLKPLKVSEVPKKILSKKKGAFYQLSVPQVIKGPIFEIDLPQGNPIYSLNDSLKFSLNKNEGQAVSYELLVDGKVVHQEENLVDQSEFSYPLSGFELGKHFIEIKMEGSHGKQTVRSQEIIIKPLVDILLSSPLEGDYFSDTLSVYAQVRALQDFKIKSVDYYIDNQLRGQSLMHPYQSVIDTRELQPGKHTLKVVVNSLDQPQELSNANTYFKEVVLYKGPHPEIKFSTPTYGEYIPLDTRVELVTNEGVFQSVDLLLDDQIIHQWTEGPYQYQWNNFNLEPGSYLLRARGLTKEGIQVSDWVLIKTGEGKLKVSPPVKQGIATLRQDIPSPVKYKKVVFILDATNSQWDYWMGKSKWEWQKDIFLMGKVTGKLLGLQNGIVVLGSKKSFRDRDCEDAQWAVPVSRFNHQEVKKELDQIKPRGVSALFHGLLMALDQKPDKIVVMTDGSDACSQKIPLSLKNKIKQSNILIDILTFGSVEKKNSEILNEIVNLGSGYFVSINKDEEVEENLEQVLTLFYRVLLDDEVVLSAPVDGQERLLRPGHYQLKISTDPPFTPQEITIRNGLIEDVLLFIDKNETTAIERSYAL